MSILRVNEFTAFPGKRENLVEAFETIVPMIRLAAGCESCRMLIDVGNEQRLFIIEQWRDISSHKASAKNIREADFKRIMSLLDTPPKGQYYTATTAT